MFCISPLLLLLSCSLLWALGRLPSGRAPGEERREPGWEGLGGKNVEVAVRADGNESERAAGKARSFTSLSPPVRGGRRPGEPRV